MYLPILFVQVLIEKGETVSGLHFIVTSSAILLYVATLHDVVLFYVGKKLGICFITIFVVPIATRQSSKKSCTFLYCRLSNYSN